MVVRVLGAFGDATWIVLAQTSSIHEKPFYALKCPVSLGVEPLDEVVGVGSFFTRVSSRKIALHTLFAAEYSPFLSRMISQTVFDLVDFKALASSLDVLGVQIVSEIALLAGEVVS